MGKKKKEKKQIEEAQTPTPELYWDYGNQLRDEASFGAILNYIAGTPDYTERDALWEFARKKRDGEFPWDGSSGECKVPPGGGAGQVLTKATSENWNMIWSDAAKGDPGDPGEKGDKGDKGDEGDPGTSATVDVGDTETLDPQFNATVTNSGTTSAAIFDFGIPKGVKGDRGTNGTDGDDGKSAYEIAVDNGFVGTEEEWLDSIEGGTGEQGPKGDGWTGGVYHENTGKVQFLSDDGLGFYTEDLRGADGEKGDAATVDAGDTETVDWDDDAEVINVGTLQEAVFDFKIPKGRAGQNGTDGTNGRSLTWMGTLPGMTELNAVVNPQQGDMYTLVDDGVHERNYQVYIRNNPPVEDPGVWVWLGPWGNPGIPEGGDANQILSKIDNENFNTQWIDNTGGGGLPPGGTTNQVLTKLDDDAAGAADWRDSQGGGGGGCFETYDDQKNCSPSDQDHLVLLDGAARPTKYVGTGRPDEDGVPGTPVEGDTYTCTDSDGDGNYGAREWRYNGSDWLCVEGRIESTLSASTQTAAGITKASNVSYIAGSILRDATSCTLNLEIGLASGSSNQIHFANLSPDNEWYAYITAPPEIERVSGSAWFAEGNNKIVGTSPARVNRTNNQLFTNPLHAVATPYVTVTMEVVLPPSKSWPTSASTFTVEELKTKIEQAAKDNPELAEQLRQELEALRSEDA